MLSIIAKINSDYFPVQNSPVGLDNAYDGHCLRNANWIFLYKISRVLVLSFKEFRISSFISWQPKDHRVTNMWTVTRDTPSEYRIFEKSSFREIQKQLIIIMLKRFSSKFERFLGIPDDSIQCKLLRVMMLVLVVKGYRISWVILKIILKSTLFFLFFIFSFNKGNCHLNCAAFPLFFHVVSTNTEIFTSSWDHPFYSLLISAGAQCCQPCVTTVRGHKSYCSTVHFRRITSIYQPTNAHIIPHKTLLNHFKTL